METSPGLFRSALRPSQRRTHLITFGGAAAVLALGLGIGHVIGERSMSVLPVVTPVVVEAPKVPAPIVNVPAQATPIVNVNVPPPPPPPAPPPAPAPRVLSPHLDAGCYLGGAQGCWGNGLPAISADGALVAYEHADDDDRTGMPGVAIVFLDATTGRTVRSERLFSTEERNLFGEGSIFVPSEVHEDPERLGRARAAAMQKIVRRVAATQRTLEARGFRSLVSLGGGDSNMGGDGEEPTAAEATGPAKQDVYAQFHGDAARIIDPARNVELWRHTFYVSGPQRPKHIAAEDDFCGGATLRSLQLWWDPSARVVLASKHYTTGGCMCPSGAEFEVRRIPASAFPAPASPAPASVPAPAAQ